MPSKPPNLELRTATTQDKNRIVLFLRTSFYKDEPLNKSIGLVTREKPNNEEAESFSLANFDQGCAVVALVEGKLVGVCLGEVVRRNVENHMPEVKDEPLAKLMGLFRHLARQSKVFEKFADCDRGLEVNILSVEESYRGRGIAKEMLQRFRELGKDKNCGFIKMDCTSYYSASAAKSLGFELIYSLNYSDYHVNNELVFRPEPPHTAATVYAKYIDV